MSKILLSSEKTIKEMTVLPDNLNGQVIQQSIIEAQEIYLQEIIGTQLLDKLCELVKDGSIMDDENEKYKTLLDKYIQPFICYRALAEIQYPLLLQNRNLGDVKTTDTNVGSASVNEVDKLINFYRNKASFFSNRLSKYLCKNKVNYPEYKHCDCSGFGARTTLYIPTVL